MIKNDNEEKGFFIEGEDMSMEELLDMGNEVNEGDNRIVKGTVVSVGKDDIMLDVGMKSEVFIPIAEFYDDNNNICVKVGELVEVFAGKRNNFSYRKAREMKAIEEIHSKFQKQESFEGKIVSSNKGGYIVYIGVHAFMPMSQIPFGAKKDDLIGSKVQVLVLEINKGNVVVSAKAVSDKLRLENAAKIKENLEVGVNMRGVVKSIKPYGAFIDLGGIDGLLHLSDMSWVRVHKPQDIVSLGDKIEVQILSFDDNKEKISLGLKQLTEDPWDKLSFLEGDLIEGKVKKVIKNGAIIVIGDSIEGFIHISDFSWIERIHKISDVMNEGDIVKVKVLKINKEERKISFGLKQIEESPWEIFIKEFHTGDRIAGKVTSVTDFGVFVEVAKGLEGMIHISDLAWEKTEELNKNSFTKGEELEVVILRINNEDRKLSLGLKQKNIDPMLKYRMKKNYQGELVEIREDELILKFNDGVKGLIPKFYAGEEKAIDLKEKFELGQKIDVKLIKVNSKDREIVFSIKDYLKEQEKKTVKEYLGKDDGSAVTFGDLISEKLKDKLKDLK
ncbi:MAG: S1 RNA-binding domain-containing protein [bacterium]|nr:S1 RNA-binding domain-containing protein [bacterium]